MFIVVTYDIIDDKRRSKIAKRLKDYGIRVQKSVFECLLEEEKIKCMIEKATPLLKEEDSFRIYCLCESCRKKIKSYGDERITDDPEVYIV